MPIPKLYRISFYDGLEYKVEALTKDWAIRKAEKMWQNDHVPRVPMRVEVIEMEGE